MPYEQFPRVVRVRELLESGRTRTLAEINRFNRHVFFDGSTDDMSLLVVNGTTVNAAGTHRSAGVFDVDTGRLLCSVSAPTADIHGSARLDPNGRVLVVCFDKDGPAALYRMPDGTPLGTVKEWREPVAAGRLQIAQRSLPESDRTVTDLLRLRDGHRLLTLGAETLSTVGPRHQFGPDGRTMAWTHVDGTVALADLSDLNARLTPLGLGWEEVER